MGDDNSKLEGLRDNDQLEAFRIAAHAWCKLYGLSPEELVVKPCDRHEERWKSVARKLRDHHTMNMVIDRYVIPWQGNTLL